MTVLNVAHEPTKQLKPGDVVRDFLGNEGVFVEGYIHDGSQRVVVKDYRFSPERREFLAATFGLRVKEAK